MENQIEVHSLRRGLAFRAESNLGEAPLDLPLNALDDLVPVRAGDRRNSSRFKLLSQSSRNSTIVLRRSLDSK